MWATGLACLDAGATARNPGWPHIQLFSNITDYRVWFHQNANGTGWADCFNPQSSWSIFGRDESPGNIQATKNLALCTSGFPPSSDQGQCGENFGGNTPNFLDANGPNYNSSDTCYEDPVGQVHTDPWSGKAWLTYNSGFRAWLHQNPSGSGWADCFRDAIYFIADTRDSTPGNVLFSTTNSACPKGS